MRYPFGAVGNVLGIQLHSSAAGPLIVDILCNHLSWLSGHRSSTSNCGCRQDDDFSIGTKDPAVAGNLIIALINYQVERPRNTGVDILQNLSCETFN